MTTATATRSPVLIRTGLVLLAASQAVVGVWALLGPRSFYDGFPAAGHAWVALLPPFNEHLVRDVGGLSLALTVLLGTAAVIVDRTLVRVALAAFAVYLLPHTVFHGLHLHGFSAADAAAQMAGFSVQLGIALGLLLLTTRRRTTDDRSR